MIKRFESFKKGESILIIVDVQKSFSKFFTDKYIKELKKYCSGYSEVYQIWDNHIDGQYVDDDYLFSDSPGIPVHEDLYYFPNQSDIFEKRYNYNVDVSFYKSILDKKTFSHIKKLEEEGLIKRGDSFITKKRTLITYIGNKHKWSHIGVRIVKFLLSQKGKDVTIVGGSDSECLEDFFISSKSLGVDLKRDHRFIYSANHCPIK